jgi:agmatinase
MHDFAFLSDSTFLRAGREPGPAQRPFAVAGLAWDGATTNRPGARFGPRAIRQASHMLCDGIHPYFGCSPMEHVVDLGDLPLPNTSLEAMRAALARQLPGLLAARHMVWLGGDHSVTLPILRALKARHGRPLAVLHFDAHCDTWSDHFGEPSGHGTWVYEAMQEGLVVNACFTQIGIRSAGDPQARDHVRNQGGLLFTARDLRGLDNSAELAAVVAAVRQRLREQGHPPVYLSLDIDCLDPAFAPGTGTPEPAGLSTGQVMTLLEDLADLDFVGMDCVEVSPPFDHAEITAYAAASFVWTYLAGRVARLATA